MKTIVQNLRDRSYLGEGCDWVKEQEKAKSFSRSTDALEFCLRYNIQDVELVMVNEDGSEIVRVAR